MEKATATNPTNGLMYNSLAYGYATQKKFDKAIAAAQKQVELSPKQPNPYDTKGEIELIAGKFKDAEATFRKTLEIDPSFLLALDGVAAAQTYRGDFDGALATRREEFKRHTVAINRFAARFAELMVLALSGKDAEALKRTNELIELGNEAGMIGEVNAAAARYRIHVHRDNFKAAHKEAKAALAALKGKKPTPQQAAQTHAILVHAAARAGDAAGAAKAYEGHAPLTKGGPFHHFAKGHLAWAAGDNDKALAEFAAMKGQFNASAGTFAAAELLTSLKKTDEAKAKWTELSSHYQRDIDSMMTWYQVKEKLRALGKVSK